MLEKYLELVDDVERRLQLAKEHLMNKFAADVNIQRIMYCLALTANLTIVFFQILIKMKDRRRLTELRASINTSHEVDYVQRFIDNALRTSTIKWKN